MKTSNQDSSVNISKVINGNRVTWTNCVDGFNNIVWQRNVSTGSGVTTNTIITITNMDNTTCDITLPTTYGPTGSGTTKIYEFNLPLNYKSITLTANSIDGS